MRMKSGILGMCARKRFLMSWRDRAAGYACARELRQQFRVAAHRRFVRSGLKFHLVHIPPNHPPKGVDVLLHAHTHVPRNERRGGVLFLNPGCVTRPNRGAPAERGLARNRGRKDRLEASLR